MRRQQKASVYETIERVEESLSSSSEGQQEVSQEPADASTRETQSGIEPEEGKATRNSIEGEVDTLADSAGVKKDSAETELKGE